MTQRFTLAEAFKANRRPGKSPGYWRPASLALPMARAALAAIASAEAEKAAAFAELAEARKVDSRQYAPGMVSARERLAKAESAWSRAYDSAVSAWPLKGSGAALGAPWAIGGHASAKGQWCESAPFRFVGLASDLIRLDHTGYYCDPDGDGELARGVVYQLAARDGRARFVPAIADPNNAGPDGRGPAVLALAEIETAEDSTEDSAEVAKADAAARADQLAGYYAESERDYQEAFRAGQEARDKAAEATAEGKAWVGAMRALRGLYRARHTAGLVGMAPAEVRAAVAGAVASVRALCESYQEAREKAASARETGHGWRCPDCAAWREGYQEGGR